MPNAILLQHCKMVAVYLHLEALFGTLNGQRLSMNIFFG